MRFGGFGVEPSYASLDQVSFPDALNDTSRQSKLRAYRINKLYGVGGSSYSPTEDVSVYTKRALREY